MGLFCTNCKRGVPEGLSQCVECKVGYVHQLACLSCRRLVPRGASTCSCGLEKVPPLLPSPPPLDLPRQTGARISEVPETRISKSMPGGGMARMGTQMVGFVAPRSAPAIFPGLPSHVSALTVPEEYEAGRFGVTATVTMLGKDAEILNELGQLVVLLHTEAQRLTQFQGRNEHTQGLARSMRNLATEIQEEIEMRTGPPG